jgi:hypothetical protein
MSEKQNAIVERLRKYDMHEGADEIERLRAALNGIVEAARFTQDLPSPLLDAIEAARAALTQGINRDRLDC